MNVVSVPNTVDVEWPDVTMFKSQKDGLQVCFFVKYIFLITLKIVYTRNEKERTLKIYLEQSDVAEDVYKRILLERKVEEQLGKFYNFQKFKILLIKNLGNEPLPENVLRLLSS